MEIKGTKENPYSWDEYNEMFKDKKWYGGWVRIGGELRYITKDGHEEMDNSEGVLGSIDNPFSETAYEEMHSRGDWPGGYVSFSGFPEYRRSSAEENADASGCGSSGSGSEPSYGSGDGSVLPGVAVIYTEHFKLDVNWTEGSTVPGDRDCSELRIVSIEKRISTAKLNIKKIEIYWSAPYTIYLYIDYVEWNGSKWVANHDEVTVKI